MKQDEVRKKLHRVIFSVDTVAGRAFDIALLILILSSIAILMLESVSPIQKKWGPTLRLAEWTITGLFTLEYVLRIWVSDKKLRYVFSFYGLIDLFSILPTYLGLLINGSQALAIIRILRLLRVFRVLKLVQFMGEANRLREALRTSSKKIIVFVFFVLIVSVFVGTLMFLIEGPERGFTSIPTSAYWAIVTLTTVGYGDIAPQTSIGQFLATLLMVTGYGVIAVPTGLVTAEMVRTTFSEETTSPCSQCAARNPKRASYCMNCGTHLEKKSPSHELSNL